MKENAGNEARWVCGPYIGSPDFCFGIIRNKAEIKKPTGARYKSCLFFLIAEATQIYRLPG